jgi:hypothetical protein
VRAAVIEPDGQALPVAAILILIAVVKDQRLVIVIDLGDEFAQKVEAYDAGARVPGVHRDVGERQRDEDRL